MKKRILMICMCFVLVFTITFQDTQKVKAFIPAVPAVLAIGSVALGAGIYFYNKDDLQNMSSDCLSWLKDNVGDAYMELVNLSENGSKIVISSIARKGILAFLKHKFGWGNGDAIRQVNVSTDVGTKLQNIYDYVSSAKNHYLVEDDVANFVNRSNVDGVAMYYGIEPDDTNYSYFTIWEKDVTDLYYSKTDKEYYLVYSDSTVMPYYLRKDGSSRINDVLRAYINPDPSSTRNQELKCYSRSTSPKDGAVFLLFNRFFLDGKEIENVAKNVKGFPDGVRVWGSKYAYSLQDTSSSDYYGVTGDFDVYESISVGSNVDIQTEDTAISVPAVGEMTIDEFIDATKDLAIDDTPAWMDVIDKITAVDVDTDVPVDTPTEDTEPTVPPLVSDFTADLTTLFPFCLPFDLIDLVKVLSADPVAPKWNIPIKIKYGKVIDYEETFTIDMGEFDDVVKIFRTLETLGFIVGLIMITRNQMIKG